MLDAGSGGSEIQNLDGVGSERTGIGDGVVAGAATEPVEVGIRRTRKQIIAGPRGERVGSVEAVGVVIADPVDVRQRARAHRIAVPDRAIGKTYRNGVERVVGRTEGVDQHHAIAGAGEGHDEVVAVGAGPNRGDHVGQVVVGQAEDIGAREDRLDAVIAVAAAVEIGIVAVAALEKVIALAAHQRIGGVGADDDVVAIGREAGEDRQAHVRDGEPRPDGKRDGLDPDRVGTERVDDDDLVGGAGKANGNIVAVDGETVEADLGGGIA